MIYYRFKTSILRAPHSIETPQAERENAIFT